MPDLEDSSYGAAVSLLEKSNWRISLARATALSAEWTVGWPTREMAYMFVKACLWQVATQRARSPSEMSGRLPPSASATAASTRPISDSDYRPSKRIGVDVIIGRKGVEMKSQREEKGCLVPPASPTRTERPAAKKCGARRGFNQPPLRGTLRRSSSRKPAARPWSRSRRTCACPLRFCGRRRAGGRGRR